MEKTVGFTCEEIKELFIRADSMFRGDITYDAGTIELALMIGVISYSKLCEVKEANVSIAIDFEQE